MPSNNPFHFYRCICLPNKSNIFNSLPSYVTTITILYFLCRKVSFLYKLSQSIHSKVMIKANVTKKAKELQHIKQEQTSQPAQVISQCPSPFDSINARGMYKNFILYIYSLCVCVYIYIYKSKYFIFMLL